MILIYIFIAFVGMVVGASMLCYASEAYDNVRHDGFLVVLGCWVHHLATYLVVLVLFTGALSILRSEKADHDLSLPAKTPCEVCV